MEERYIENTKQALDFGIFGVPSFSFSNEIFWETTDWKTQFA